MPRVQHRESIQFGLSSLSFPRVLSFIHIRNKYSKMAFVRAFAHVLNLHIFLFIMFPRVPTSSASLPLTHALSLRIAPSIQFIYKYFERTRIQLIVLFLVSANYFVCGTILWCVSLSGLLPFAADHWRQLLAGNSHVNFAFRSGCD